MMMTRIRSQWWWWKEVVDPVYILKVQVSGFPDELDAGAEKKKIKDVSKVFSLSK